MFKHEVETPEPHSCDAVATLAKMLGLADAPEVLKLNDHIALVQGSAGYYSMTKAEGQPWRCTCPAGRHGRICKHLRAFSGFMREESRKTKPSAFDEAGNIRREQQHGGFRPTLEA